MSPAPPPRYRVASPPAERPLLVFDGECRFCRLWVGRWSGLTAGRIDTAPSQAVAADFPEIPAEAFERSVILIGPDGLATGGAEAVFRALAAARSRRWPLAVYERVTGAAWLAESMYGFVSRNRALFSRLTRWLWGERVELPTYGSARCWFLRLLGLVYLIAFLSIWVQIGGLVGERGILPAVPSLEGARAQWGAKAYGLLPTLFWLSPGEPMLHGLCGAGTLLSAALVLGFLPVPILILLWGLYLSLATICGIFLGFQWDNLLLEAGLLAVFLAPWRARCGLACESSPPRLASWLVRWLLFRLMFASGFVKLASGDAAWRSLSALEFHYFTQPLPLPTSWYMHQLPAWFHAASAAVLLSVELIIPFLIFAPRRPRLAALVSFAGLQLAIAATGNYAFFNLLTIGLCLFLIADGDWPSGAGAARGEGVPSRRTRSTEHRGRMTPTVRERSSRSEPGPTSTNGASEGFPRGEARAGQPLEEIAGPRREEGDLRLEAAKGRAARWSRPRPASLWAAGEWPFLAVLPFGLVLLLLSLVRFGGTLGWDGPGRSPMRPLVEAAAPFRFVNGYGSFAVMTASRREIVVEGSQDGATWLPYEFKWKPGDPRRAPPIVAPHQPRLDWQMWFAARGDYRASAWFGKLLARLLEGSPPVLELLETNPFPDAPPRYVRAMLYDYHFTGAAEGARDGAWWRRELLGPYSPVLSLRGEAPRLAEVGAPRTLDDRAPARGRMEKRGETRGSEELGPDGRVDDRAPGRGRMEKRGETGGSEELGPDGRVDDRASGRAACR